MIITGMVLLISFITLIITNYIHLKGDLKENISTLASIIGANSTAAILFDDADAAEETLQTLDAEPHIYSAKIFTPEGKLFAEFQRYQSSSKETINIEKFYENKDFSFRFEKDYLFLSNKIFLEKEWIGTVLIQAELAKFYSQFKNEAWNVSLITISSFGLIYVLSILLLRIITKPMSHLAETIKQVSENKDYSLRAEKHSDDELGTLIEGFNAMLIQVQIRDEELVKHRDDLEREIEERTKELSNINKNLDEKVKKLNWH